ncbi:[Ni-Fe] hydrogenase, cytochrome b subunit [Campylobacter blaseri]|uniref:Ni/Fe-hydrogenase, b-type cytochrome subunit n=1 Tax=Campylobacter blaseri TaxID=2042961 RepID=A0A2P8QYT1_9BACT|nr:Ni/Fe-hydrogenase, b-type cytochrome subunit [Campylobacter blaseri]PSM51400.1 Ni/Fe-hydrogenase, b-type cytochrome subunit [Campylobacter blaseri]PSM52850.1 Ni/Fe-hydrogenase, b-type cytochrome subunit [Campylobacter blaseri]QKF86153.1 [Ni-Fe] hydrogenase, cytochrome b subunit [Campylobacter blaseri]
MKINAERKAEYEFSIGYRATHWIRAITIAVLIVSGLYIAYVFQSANINDEPVLFLQAKWRFVHLVAGFIMIGAIIFKSYLFVFDKLSRRELVSILDFINPKIWIDQIKFYLFIGDHPQLKGVYNPLQFIAYIIFYAVAFLISITGLILYVHVYHNGLGGLLYEPLREIEVAMGGLANVRAIHHICMNIIIFFVCVHVYMAVFNAIKGKNGAIDAIISGYKFPAKD